MADDNGKSDKKRPLTRAEKFKNYGIGIGAMSALLLGIWANVKGEPTAEKTWITLRGQVNELTEMVNKLNQRVVFLQAHESGRMAARLQLKLDATEKKLAALGAAPTASAPTGSKPRVTHHGSAAVLNKPQKKCKAGYVLVDDRCRQAHKAVAKKMARDAVEKADARRKLLEEKRKRMEAEKRMMQQRAAPAPPAPLPLKKLPKKLDDASKNF